jgi:hypothetical protein
MIEGMEEWGRELVRIDSCHAPNRGLALERSGKAETYGRPEWHGQETVPQREASVEA